MNIPFPQANDLGKILLLIDKYHYSTKKELLSILELSTERQYDYYVNAAIFLGFIKKENKKKRLTKSGMVISGESSSFKKERFILELLKHPLIKSVIFNYKEKTIFEILEKFNSFKSLAISTKNRRVSTIKKWVQWLNKNI
tara:strand:+ start:159 stop:581 length:423 start_codon:yes stop_codon:yes gene_type:complete